MPFSHELTRIFTNKKQQEEILALKYLHTCIIFLLLSF